MKEKNLKLELFRREKPILDRSDTGDLSVVCVYALANISHVKVDLLVTRKGNVSFFFFNNNKKRLYYELILD